jgi:hypothetical protein
MARVPGRFVTAHPLRAAAVYVAVGLAGTLAGCSPKNVLVPNLPPETILFVQGPVDTVNHVVRLFWFGTDQDGFVQRFELRFLNPANPGDSAWVSTTRTDSLFTVFTPAGLTSPVFEVRAIDDAGERDPSPARQDFTFRNAPPVVTIVGDPAPNDTTFASLTLSWQPADPDGDVALMQYRVWLDGNEAGARVTGATTFTIPTDDFRQGGQLLSGRRTAYVQPIDGGGMAGAPDSTRWFVRAPVTGARARLLVIDDVPSSNPAGFSTDTMYANAAARNLPADEWSLLRLEFTQPFDSDADLAQTFALFEAVVWYRGTEPTFSPVMASYEQGIRDYLDGGGRLMLEGFQLIDGQNARGALSEEFMRDYLGADRLFKHFDVTLQDSVATWGIGNARPLRSPMYQDSLRSQGIFVGLRAMAVGDTNHVALWARAGTLSQPHAIDLPVAVSVPLPGGGRAIAVTMPLRAANGYLTVPRFLPKILDQMGILGP